MEVDRISRMGGVGHEGAPSWTRDKMHRRKFVEEVEAAEDEAEQEAAGPDEPEQDHGGALDLMA